MVREAFTAPDGLVHQITVEAAAGSCSGSATASGRRGSRWRRAEARFDHRAVVWRKHAETGGVTPAQKQTCVSGPRTTRRASSARLGSTRVGGTVTVTELRVADTPGCGRRAGLAARR